MFFRILFTLICVLAFGFSGLSCDSCGCNMGDPARGGGSGITAGINDFRKPLTVLTPESKSPEPALSSDVPDLKQDTPLPEKTAEKPRRWSVDTSFEFREFQDNRAENSYKIVQDGHDQHAYRFDYFFNEHIGYVVTDDLSVGIGAGFRDLHKVEVADSARIGQRETSTGATDPEFDVKYRFMRQSECFPVDLAVFAGVKTNFGETHNRKPDGQLFESEDQPGSGAWNETLGLAASHGWEKWGASGAMSYTHKAEGSQLFKEGDVARFTLSGSRLLSPQSCDWKLYGSMGLQGLIERHAQVEGFADPDHGGRFMYILPGVAAKPNDRFIVSLTAPIPVIQDENGTHQKQRWTVQLGVGYRF